MASVLAGHGKDDFWAALQTNYNYIMDTNLLDSCREARGELLDGNGQSGTSCFATSAVRGDEEEYKDDEDDSDGAAKVSVCNKFIMKISLKVYFNNYLARPAVQSVR